MSSYRPGPLVCVALIAFFVAPAGGRSEPPGLSPAQNEVLALVCAECHARPGIGVPRIGDEAAWRPRRERGFEALFRNTVDGFGDMPPLGTCSWCSEPDLRALVAWLAGVPAAPAEPAP